MTKEEPSVLGIILDKLENMDAKMDRLDSRQDAMNATLVKQEANLGEHMRRSDLLEKRQDKIDSNVEFKLSRLESELRPVKAHVALMRTGFRVACWACGVALAAVGAVESVAKILEILGKR